MRDLASYARQLPVFEFGSDDLNRGFIVCRYAGREWYLIEPIEHVDYSDRWGHSRSRRELTLSFRMCEIPKPPPDLTIPDNIVLGEN